MIGRVGQTPEPMLSADIKSESDPFLNNNNQGEVPPPNMGPGSHLSGPHNGMLGSHMGPIGTNGSSQHQPHHSPVSSSSAPSSHNNTGIPVPTSSSSSSSTMNSGVAANNCHVKQCAACGGKILERFLLHAMERYWHTACLKCSCCQAQLGDIGQTCFTKAGMILCKNDYLRMFGCTGTCAACGQQIPASEMVMKAQGSVYHVNCFTCVQCHNRLVPGDRFSIINGSLICEHDYPKVVRGQTQMPLRPSNKVC